jgi:hypothetical protein
MNHDLTVVHEALTTLRRYATTEKDSAGLSEMLIGMNNVLDILDYRVEHKPRIHTAEGLSVSRPNPTISLSAKN